MEIRGLNTGGRQQWPASVSCWWSAAQKRLEESWLLHGYGQEQQEVPWLLLAQRWVCCWQSWLREGQPALAAETGFSSTAQWMVTFTSSSWSTWASSRGRWDKMDVDLISFLPPDAENSGVLLESCGFWATKCLICLMEMDQKMSWWLQRLSDCEGAASTFTALIWPKQQQENFSGSSCSPLI